MHNDVWAEVNLENIKYNFNVLKKSLMPETGIIAVVKSNAYGHGLVETSRALSDVGADMLAVTSIKEALDLRQNNITTAIINLSYTAPEDVEQCITKKITATIYDAGQAEKCNQIASDLRKPLRVHLKIDTGMSRLGILAEEVEALVPKIMRYPYLRVDGLYSHFADETDAQMVQNQYQNMQMALFSLQKQGLVVPAVHMAKSGVVFKSNQYHFDAVRAGMALYGYEDYGKNLRPSMTLKTVLAQVKKIKAGASVGYMQTFTTSKDLLIGVLPIGYAHGIDRGLSNVGHVLVDGWKCPIIGRVCMAQTIVDLSPVLMTSRIKMGDEVVVLGKQGKQEITARQIADWLGTNTYEVVTRIPESVPRIYMN
ncbi:MAG: alanine racemase [Patescibacteria group bacterium]|jgi:alanine racemase